LPTKNKQKSVCRGRAALLSGGFLIKWFDRYIQTDNHYFLITHSLKAFILSYKNVGEHDRRYFLLSREFGKIEAISRSVLKPKSKLVGHLEPPNFSWVEVIESAKGFQITQALEELSFPGIRSSHPALKNVLKNAGFISEFLPFPFFKHHQARVLAPAEVFQFWAGYLKTMETSFALKTELDLDLFEAELVLLVLKKLGFLPDFFRCFGCEKQLNNEIAVFFDGRSFCPECSKKKNIPGEKISPKAFADFSRILEQDWLLVSENKDLIKKIAFYFQKQAYAYML